MDNDYTLLYIHQPFIIQLYTLRLLILIKLEQSQDTRLSLVYTGYQVERNRINDNSIKISLLLNVKSMECLLNCCVSFSETS